MLLMEVIIIKRLRNTALDAYEREEGTVIRF